MEIKQLKISDIHPKMLNYFNRYQKVTQCWREKENKFVLEDVSYIRDWDEDKKMGCKCAKEIIQELIDEPNDLQLEYELCDHI